MNEEPQKEQLPQDFLALSKLKQRLFDLWANYDGFLRTNEFRELKRQLMFL